MSDGDNNGGPQGFDARDAARKASRKVEGGPVGETVAPDARSGWERQSDKIKDINRTADAVDRIAGYQAARREDNTLDNSTYVPARILWPALGFPAVIAPGSKEPAIAARALCLLVLSARDPNRIRLSKEEVARHLRIVPWADRRKSRHPRAGGVESFREEEIEVRPTDSYLDDGRAQIINLGGTRNLGDKTGNDGFLVGLSTWVRKFYAGQLEDFPLPDDQRLPYLYEVRILEHAMARFAPASPGGNGDSTTRAIDAASAQLPTQYHVFWVNRGRDDSEKDRSEEMHLLLERYARKSRFGHDGVRSLADFRGKTREAYERKHLREYEYEFGRPDAPAHRTETLHPVFVTPASSTLRIGHVTDLHVDIRTEKYAENLNNLRNTGEASAASAKFHNWNDACIKLYEESRRDCDVLLMTGDLIDYGRGYNGTGPLDDNKSYWRDRNWFLFHEFLAAGDKYTRPVYTSLGNHDWRFNPYPADTFGSPSAKDFALSKKDLHLAHGDGFSKFTYSTDPWMAGSFILQKIYNRIVGSGNLTPGRSPLETRVESVAWYLLVINPFLDYAWRLPGGFHVVMLDWAEAEDVDLPVILGGKSTGKNAFPNTYGGPKSRDCLTHVQKELVEHVAGSSSRAKILAIHAPPIGPWGHWKDDELSRGRVRYTPNDLTALPAAHGLGLRYEPTNKKLEDGERADSLKRLRGATFEYELLIALRDGHEFPAWEYPTLAFRTHADEPLGREADYGSFDEQREWLIRRLRQAKFNLVLAGHIHRKNVLVIDDVGKDLPAEWRGKWVVRCIPVTQAPTAQQPLFVNTTSAGPLGHCEISRGKYMVAESAYTKIVVTASGAISSVEFKPDVCLPPVPAEGPSPALPAAKQPAKVTT